MQKDMIHTVLRGMCVGGTMLVPGVSGGSMAMILGVYDRLVTSVSSFFKHKKESLLFLGLFSMGGLLGMVLFANPLLYLIEAYPMPMLYFFIGAVAGGIPLMFEKSQTERFSWKAVIYLALGVFIVLVMTKIPQENLGQASADAGMKIYVMLLISGILAAVALVLPGISVSFMLLVMGLYETIVEALGNFRLGILIPFGIGVLLGIILTTKLLELAMERYPQPTYLMILGFIIGSVGEIFPGIPEGMEWITCSLMLAAGFGIIQLISRDETKEQMEAEY